MLGICVIPLFHGILSQKSIYGIILVIQNHLQGRKVISKVENKMAADISRSNMIFQQIKPGTSVIPHFYVNLTGQSVSCIIFMTQGHLQGQNLNFKVK